jgi:hypothetical protein
VVAALQEANARLPEQNAELYAENAELKAQLATNNRMKASQSGRPAVGAPLVTARRKGRSPEPPGARACPRPAALSCEPRVHPDHACWPACKSTLSENFRSLGVPTGRVRRVRGGVPGRVVNLG